MTDQEEVWVPWPEPPLDTAYEISSRGRVRSIDRVLGGKGRERVMEGQIRRVGADSCITLFVGGSPYGRSVRKAFYKAFGRFPARRDA